MTFNVYAVPPALTGSILFFLAIFVFSRSRYSQVNLLLSFFCFSLTWWLLGYTINYLSEDPNEALFWARFGCMGIVFIPLFTFHFIVKFLNRKVKFWTWSFYLLSLPILFLVWTPLIYKGINKHFWGYYPVAGKFYWIILFSFLMSFSVGVVFLFQEFFRLKKRSDLRKYNQVKFVFLGFMIGCFGAVDYIIKYGLDIYPFGYIAALIFATSIIYAIFRHQLLGIDVFIKRTVVFAGLLAFVFGVFAVATIFVQKILSIYFRASDFWSYAISIFLIVLGYDPIRNLLVNLTDKYLFQKKYDYQKLLKDATRGISKIESLDHLLNLVTHFVTMRMRLKNAAILMKERDSDFFIMHNQRGYEKNYFEYRVNYSEPLFAYLDGEREAIDLERLKEAIAQGGKKKKKASEAIPTPNYNLEAIKTKMEELNAVCCVPSFLGHELRSVLILGEKKSGDYYTDDDLNVLFTLAQESAIAIENARLFDEAIKKTHELEKINEQLEYSKNLLIRALKETEVANKQLQDTQAQLIHEQKMATLGRLAASVGHEVNNPLTILSMNVSRAILKYRKNPDMKVGEILELFDKMEQNIGRIKAVVNTLTGLLKRSEKGKFEPLSLKLILEETLPLVQFQTYLDNLTGTEVEFDVPANTPLVIGDLERLQEVFLNLFINAYHAMEGRRNRKIKVTAEVDPANSKQLAIHFTDNGSGMTEEIMKKIFNYAFTTKGPGKGSGMGLYMCKYIIELHGGDIKVASKVGEGTTFTLTLPVYIEATSASEEGRVEASN